MGKKKTHNIKHVVSPVLDLDNGIVNAYSIKQSKI